MDKKVSSEFGKLSWSPLVIISAFGLIVSTVIGVGVSGAANAKMQSQSTDKMTERLITGQDGMTYEIAQQSPRSSNNGRRPGPPPREALEVCETQKIDSACTFTDKRRNKSISGTCRQSPRGEKVCVPNGAKPPKA